MHTKLELDFVKKNNGYIYNAFLKKMYNLFKFSHNLKAIEMFEISKLQTFFLTIELCIPKQKILFYCLHAHIFNQPNFLRAS